MTIIAVLITILSGHSKAQDLQAKKYLYAGPFAINTPIYIDSLDVNGNKYDNNSMLDFLPPFNLLDKQKTVNNDTLPITDAKQALHLIRFYIQNQSYIKPKLEVNGIKKYKIYIDRNLTDAKNLKLQPQTHEVIITCLTEKGQKVKPVFTLKNAGNNTTLRHQDHHTMNIMDVIHARQVGSVSLSPDAQYAIHTEYKTNAQGNNDWIWKITHLKNKKVILTTTKNIHWLPGTNAYYEIKKIGNKNSLIVTDINTGNDSIWCDKLPEGNITFAPDARYIIVTKREKAARENEDVYQITAPDDRQPGYRTRENLYIMDLETGLSTPLTYGYHNVGLQDISRDGQKILVIITKQHLTQRPTTRHTVAEIDLKTRQMRTIIKEDGFIASARYSPDARRIVVNGSPEALGGIGNRVGKGLTPNMYDYHLYTVDIATGKATPLTADIKPSIKNFTWNAQDNMIYATTYEKDYVTMYRIDPQTLKIKKLPLPEEMILGYDLADKTHQMIWYGESASSSDRIYMTDLKSLKTRMIKDFNPENLKGIRLGKCQNWDCVSEQGDTIIGRYYTPADFDPQKKYPMIVYYYGGCSPSSRNFESLYPFHAYTSQGYVVFVVNPSGAAGYGQQRAAKHVNTAGKGVADEIIHATKAFTQAHPFIDPKAIGCMGASYGGFMTQYLQTVTDIFAAAISHAGISDHTSYWGEGYWGYSYSEVSMANSYPWKDKQLFVDQSPLYRADKIHTPLLLIHGDADTNVPVGESIQLYNALKLQGKETALVLVKGENHHILNYFKRLKWQETIFAWFAKHLKKDNSWWDALYPEKKL